ncbi:MAG: hypothetical protein AAGF12_17015 [Myxococcota bacterium]
MGTRDRWLAPARDTERALREAGVTTKFVPIADAGHSLTDLSWSHLSRWLSQP